MSSGGRYVTFWGFASGVPNARSDGAILLDALRGGAAKAARPLDRLRGDNLSPSTGFASAVSEGLRAFLSRRPNVLESINSCSLPLLLPLLAVLVGDRLIARAKMSGCDLARLAFVGD